jgi:hypothetical protein
MKRRDLLKLTVSAASMPAAAVAQEHTHAAPSVPAAGEWKPFVFDAHQNETLILLSDLILPATDTPGAKAARVNQHIDLLLRDGPAENREKFLEGLGWMDGYARRKYGHALIGCTLEQQTAVLETLSASHEEGTEAGRRFFQSAKSIIARTYYNTEIGYRELNKGGRVPATFGCPA